MQEGKIKKRKDERMEQRGKISRGDQNKRNLKKGNEEETKEGSRKTVQERQQGSKQENKEGETEMGAGPTLQLTWMKM